ncbi:hypothetical protein SCAR479_04889 [Seiridium cardinale]|uniref:Uncharacterized protein n=1 Tax=Seiridium cardinale TaxID=138064 RepID=A0ABR2Y507_9PEZI
MEAAAKSIKSLVSVLPDRPHQLSISPDSRYHLEPNDARLEEDVIRPLQYMTYLFDVDRGLLLTRAYSDIRDEESHAPKPSKPPPDPNKPRTKVSLQDYKRKKQETNSFDSNSSTPKPVSKPVEKDRRPAIKKEESPSVDSMLKQATLKKAHPSLPPRPDVRRPGAEPSPERKKRPSDVNEDRPVKRTRLEGTPNGLSRLASRSDPPSKAAEKPNSNDKKLSSKELRPSPMPATNGRSALNNTGTHGASPRPSSQVNGSSQKPATSKDNTPKKDKANAGARELKSIPMVSPIGPELGSRIPGYESSPRSKPADKDGKSQVKRTREEPERSSTPKRPKLDLPPLLSPTLPPIVREAQATADKKLPSSKDSSQRSALAVDSPGSAKKAPVKSEKEDTIYVDSKKERKDETPQKIVKLKYPKKLAKTISRLLALAPKKKPEAPRKDLLEPPKRDDRAGRERSNSLEPISSASARKRPPTDTGEHPSAIKRPRTSEIAQPSTPSKHNTAMQRVASSSSQAGTPGATNLTPGAPGAPGTLISDRRSSSVDPERTSRLREKHAALSGLGTKLKRQRDRIIKPKENSGAINLSQRERNALMATGLQSAVAYMAGFKAMDDMRDAERKIRDPLIWKSLMPLMRVYRADCSSSYQLSALILRLHCIALLWNGRTITALGPDNANNARELFQNVREQEHMWKAAGEARKRLDDIQNGEDNGPIARLIDRLGPWSTSEDVVGVTLKILRKVIRLDDEKFIPEPELTQACELMVNGS